MCVVLIVFFLFFFLFVTSLFKIKTTNNFEIFTSTMYVL